jgi:hypothetical protein
MEEQAFIHAGFPAAKTPVRAENEVEPKQLVFRFRQGAPDHQVEIGDIFFIFSAPAAARFTGCAILERDAAFVQILVRTLDVTFKADPEDCPQDAVTGRSLSLYL